MNIETELPEVLAAIPVHAIATGGGPATGKNAAAVAGRAACEVLEARKTAIQSIRKKAELSLLYDQLSEPEIESEPVQAVAPRTLSEIAVQATDAIYRKSRPLRKAGQIDPETEKLSRLTESQLEDQQERLEALLMKGELDRDGAKRLHNVHRALLVFEHARGKKVERLKGPPR